MQIYSWRNGEKHGFTAKLRPNEGKRKKNAVKTLKLSSKKTKKSQLISAWKYFLRFVVLVVELISASLDPETVRFSKVDPVAGTVVEFKGPGGAKVAYDSPHADMDAALGHDKPHVGWQGAGKRGSGGAQRGNITYEGEQHPHRPDTKESCKC